MLSTTIAVATGLTLLRPTVAVGQDIPQLRLELTLPADRTLQFGGVGDADLWRDGRVAVLDPEARAVYVFAPDGRVLDTLPHHDGMLANLAIGPDGRLAVTDVEQGRLALWSADGVFLGSVAIRPGWPAPRHLMWTGAGIVYKTTGFGEGRLRFERVAAGDSAVTLLAFTLDRNFRARSTCAWCAFSLSTSGNPLVAAPDTIYRVTEFDAAGQAVRVFARTDVPAVRRSPHAFDALHRQLRRGPRGIERRTFRHLRTPPRFKLRVTGIAVDALGRVWIRLNPPDGEPGILDVFTPEGRFFGSVPLDRDIELLRIRGDLLLAIGRRPTGERVVLVYRIIDVFD